MTRILHIVFALALGAAAGTSAFNDPLAAARVSGTAATVLALLASVSLAVFSVLASNAPSTNKESQKTKRIATLVNREDQSISDQNLFVFYVLFVSLGLCLATGFTVPESTNTPLSIWIRGLAACAGFGTGISLTLSLILRAIAFGLSC